MANPGNYNTPEDSNLIGIIKKLTDRVTALEKLTRASATSIDGGVLEVKSVTGKLLWAFGDIAKAGVVDSATGLPVTRADGSIQMGVAAFRDSGEIAFTVLDLSNGGTYKQYWSLWDVQGNVIMSDDVVSGQGLARPYIPMAFIPTDTTVWGATQGALFTDMAQSSFNAQHPQIYIDLLMYCDSGTSGQMRLIMDDTTQFGPTISGGSGFTLMTPSYIKLPALAWGTNHTLAVQACRTAGTGNVKVAVRGCYGVQS